jgi:DNA repair protein RadA/Sms
VTLLGGEPGIGKSTLLMQLLAAWPKKTLYVTAEESTQQVRLRAERLGALNDNVWLLAEMSLPNIFNAIQ